LAARHCSKNKSNLSALFTHAGQSETIYSATTVDTTKPTTHSIDYVVTDASGLTSTTTATSTNP
jgi:hypothetical protein